MQDFRNLKVWKAALALTVDVYRDTQQFPDVERYGLLPQVRRKHFDRSEHRRGMRTRQRRGFRQIPKDIVGLGQRVHPCLVLALEPGYLDPRVMSRREAAVGEVKRMLWSLIPKLRCGWSASSLSA